MKSNFNEFKNIKTDKMKGVPEPEKIKSYDSNSVIRDLPVAHREVLKKENIYDCIKDRKSTRFYSDEQVSLEELSYMLWATQGILGENKGGLIHKTVPCSGATHTFETYLFINNVENLERGIYRYLPVEHKLLFVEALSDVDERLDAITLDQPFVANFARKAAVTFAWSTTPYRSEWKFDISAHKKILIDVGHICQNLYLASESVDIGVCTIGIYDQEAIDKILQLDGEEEFVVYLAATGKKNNK